MYILLYLLQVNSISNDYHEIESESIGFHGHHKRYFKIDQQIVRHSVQFSECLLNPSYLLRNSNNCPFS